MKQLWSQFEGQTVEQKYVLGKLLGTGGFGGVFLAEHVVSGQVLRKVALKLMPAAADGGADLGELLGATAVRHQHLLSCHDAGETVVGGLRVLYLVMELAEGNLAEQLARGPLPVPEARTLAHHLSSALAHLHAQGQVHRDVKPANVLRIGQDWKLSDFGLLRAIDAGQTNRTENVFGTERYLPPEAYDGIVSPAWDMWSFGVTLREALTGRAWVPVSDEVTRRSVPGAERPGREQLPPPFDATVAGCMRHDWKVRMTAESVLRVLDGEVGQHQKWEDATRCTLPAAPRREKSEQNWSWPAWPTKAWIAVGIGGLVLLLLLLWPRRDRPTAAAPTSVPAGGGVNTASDQAAISALIEEWTETTRNRRLDQQLSLYAPRLERFFRERNVSREVVRARKESVLSRYPDLREFRVERVSIDALTAENATVSLDKVWDMVGQGRFAGAARERLALRRLNGAWRITSEEDIEVYRVVAEP